MSKQITITLTPKGPNADIDAALQEIVWYATASTFGLTYQVTATVSEERTKCGLNGCSATVEYAGTVFGADAYECPACHNVITTH